MSATPTPARDGPLTPFSGVQGTLLRIATAGSVDDGKSTLIGRLLFDSKQLFEDQMQQLVESSGPHREGEVDLELSLLTDGLRAEREQGITIDVAYRHFATPRRAFILADTPGHVRYTRNMVTGASTADLGLVLIDAANGVVQQTRRHLFIASLLRIPHVIVCVNKMDLVDYSEHVFEQICAELSGFSSRLELGDLSFIPVSALHGDNVVEPSSNMLWYGGAPLLYELEHIQIASDRNLIDLRLPVQWVIRSTAGGGHEDRGYAGKMASGVLRVGDEILVLPSGERSTVTRLETFGEQLTEAFPPLTVTVHLADQLDVSRGDVICRPRNAPQLSRDLDVVVCWMSETPCREHGRYLVKHTTRTFRGVVSELVHRIDVDTLHRDESATSAESQRDRSTALAHELATRLRPLSQQPCDGCVHPDRRGHERDGRSGNDQRLGRAACDFGRRLTIAQRERTLGAGPARSRGSLARAGLCRGDDLDHRPARGGQEHARWRTGGAAGQPRCVRAAARRRQPPARAERESRI